MTLLDALKLAKKTLEIYADQGCEHSPDFEGCGLMDEYYCAGCLARNVLRQISNIEEDER